MKFRERNPRGLTARKLVSLFRLKIGQAGLLLNLSICIKLWLSFYESIQIFKQ